MVGYRPFAQSGTDRLNLTERKTEISESTRPIKALGEVVLRVSDLDAMQEFYEKVVGLELYERYGNAIVFFRIARDYEGHARTRHCSTRLTRLTIDRSTILG